MKHVTRLAVLMVLTLLVTAGCENVLDPLSGANPATQQAKLVRVAEFSGGPEAPPSPIVTANVGGEELSFWPFIGNDFSGNGNDPVNLVFFGQADPRDIRAALLSLDGDRTAFGLPPVAPFNATWDDAIGDVLTAYGEGTGWRGSSIQLECGDHKTIRFHLRLFRLGEWTVGGAHFEVMIPGTSTHQVLSWEMAEEFITLDLMRTGLLDATNPVAATGPINPSPFRTIPAMVYNELPVELRGLIGGPLGDVTDNVPIYSNGDATIFNLAATVPRVAEQRVQSFVIDFGQVIPKPFCSSSPYDFLHVSGPVQLDQVSTLDAAGNYKTSFQATGTLTLVPIDPSTGQPSGEPLIGEVSEVHETVLTDGNDRAYSNRHQLLLPESADGAGQYFETIRVSNRGHNDYQLVVRCADGNTSVAQSSEGGRQGESSTSADRIVRF